MLARVALLLSFATALGAQNVVGRYSTKNPQGNTVVLTLEADGPARVKGSLMGPGVSFTLAGEIDEGDATGTMKSAEGSAMFEAHREGNQLRLLLVELGADGHPNAAAGVREVLFIVDNSTPAPALAAAAAPAPAPGAAGGAGSPDDQRMRQLFTSSAWCTFSYSGGSTYSGGSYGSSSRTRTVFRADGSVTQTGGSENTNSGAAGNVYGGQSNVVNAFWRYEGGQLSVSGDRASWKPVRLEMTYNSNGAPIPKLDGREYMRCQ